MADSHKGSTVGRATSNSFVGNVVLFGKQKLFNEQLWLFLFTKKDKGEHPAVNPGTLDPVGSSPWSILNATEITRARRVHGVMTRMMGFGYYQIKINQNLVFWFLFSFFFLFPFPFFFYLE